VTARTEHKAVIDSCAALERSGFEVTYLSPGADGLLAPDQVAQALRDDTIGVSIMWVNNEIGVIQDIQAIGDICRSRSVAFHVDAAQALGWLAVDLGRLPVDLMSFTAHKLCGPKGVGGLFVREGVVIEPLHFGGEQERGLRPGTLAPHQIMGLARAVELAAQPAERDHLAVLGERLKRGLLAIPEVRLNGHPEQRVPHIINVAFAGVSGEALRFALKDVAVSAGAACSADDPESSYVLRSLGLGDGLAQSSLRFSLGRFTTASEVDQALAQVDAARAELASWSVDAPEWFRR
jgi:cysteine desulfurase